MSENSIAGCSTQSGLMARFLAALLPRRRPRPQLLQALLLQVPRQRTVHQLQQLRHLAASWLAGPQLRLLDQALQQRLQLLAVELMRPQASPKSTSSRTKTGPRTGKHRR